MTRKKLMNLKSIRLKLPLTYAGIALITALVSGGTLLGILRGYYRNQEQSYLRANAIAISQAVAPLLSADQMLPDLKAHMGLYAFLSQTHLRLFDTQKKMIGDYNYMGGKDSKMMASAVTINDNRLKNAGPDALQALDDLNKSNDEANLQGSGAVSGSSGVLGFQLGVPESFKIPAGQVSGQPAQGLTIIYSSQTGNGQYTKSLFLSGSPKDSLQPENGPISGGSGGAATPSTPSTIISMIPLSATMYGYNLLGNTITAPRSDQTFKIAITDSPNQMPLGTLELSEGPAYGMDIVFKVAGGWGIASLVAVVIAALAGWWISRRMSAPVLALTGAARQMADGDLSVRANTTTNDEFGEMAHAFNEMAGQVEQTVEALKRFVSDAAHELHTPLTALHTNLDLLEDHKQPAESACAYLGQMREQLNRLEALTTGLLDLSRIESGTGHDGIETLDMVVLLRQVAEPYASRAEQSSLDFALELPDSPVNVLAGPGQLVRAVSNLLDNAIKFTPRGGRVSLALSIEADRASLSVTDSGIGIPSEDLPLIFTRFHRGRNAAGYPGSGLGLAIVKAIAEQVSGQVDVDSSPAGTKFTLTLPLAR